MRRHLPKRPLIYMGGLLLTVFLLMFSGIRVLETVFLAPEEQEAPPPSLTLTRDGVDYFPRQDITTVLVLGIDREGPAEDSGSYQNPGAADLAMVLVFDQLERTCSVLQLNRDTMLHMPVLGLEGREAGTAFGQLALSYTYGSGLADSCENTCKTISDFLYGIRIDYYVAMHMDAIPIFNDAVGGVTVEVTEDFSHIDPNIPVGTVKLMGDQAVTFVRTRKGLGDQLNISRIDRQQAYARGFLAAFREKQTQGTGFMLDAYEAASDYLITNCSSNTIVTLVDRYGDYTVEEIVSPPGENVRGEEYYEFYADPDALDEIIIRLFYAPKVR